MPKKFFLLILLFAVLVTGGIAVSLFTSAGSRAVIENTGEYLSSTDELQFESFDGTLSGGVLINGLELNNLKDFPPGSHLRVQVFELKITSPGISGIQLNIQNARLFLPNSDPVVLNGTLDGGMIDVNVFSNGFSMQELLTYFPELKKLSAYHGHTGKIDLYAKGGYQQPVLTGDIEIENFEYKGFKLKDSLWAVNLVVNQVSPLIELEGNVLITSGKILTDRVGVDVTESRLRFNGGWKNPELYVNGKTRIDRTDITIGVRGTIKDPEINLSSEPLYSRQKLMVMLATGKSWQGVEQSIETGTLSTDITDDFIDYFFFAGRKNTFAQKLGLHDMSVKLDKDARGIEAKKGLTDNLDVGFGIEQQTSDDDQNKTVTQKLQGEYKVTNTMSVGVEREIKKTRSLDDLDPAVESKEEDKVYLKYKKSF